jgi:hypothetical protein
MPRPHGLRHLWTYVRDDDAGRQVHACRRCHVRRTFLSMAVDEFQYPDGTIRRVTQRTGVPSCGRPDDPRRKTSASGGDTSCLCQLPMFPKPEPRPGMLARCTLCGRVVVEAARA